MIKIPSKNISKLDLSNSNLREIPKEVFALKNLRKLNLSGNSISRIPAEIENLKRLQTLDLSFNNVRSFYSKLCSLKKLQILNLNNNEIKTIPKQIKGLVTLRVLSIANNKLCSLSDEFALLENLKELNLSGNNFTELPRQLLGMSSIKRIWFNNNKLVDPNAYKKIKSASNFRMFNNQSDAIKTEYIIKPVAIVEKNPRKQNKKDLKYSKVIRNKIFISYSHDDKKWLEMIKKHLKVLKFDNLDFELWEDSKIKTGDNWKEEIDKALYESGIAILIISTSFLASDFIINDELPVLLNNAEKRGTKILPLIAGKSRFLKNEKLNKFQSVNSPQRPLNSLNESQIDEVLLKLTDDVEETLKNKNRAN